VTQSVHLWKSALVSGVLSVILGILLPVWSPLTVVVMVVFFGAYLAGVGHRASGLRV